MSFFKNIQEKFSAKKTEDLAQTTDEIVEVKREFKNFANSYRIGILCYYTDLQTQNEISNYKKQLENFGYECDVLMFLDQKEPENGIFLQTFDWNDLDKKTGMPHSPRTDRYTVKKYDMLFNLYFADSKPLKYLAKLSQAKCRVGPYVETLKQVSDILIICENDTSISSLIIKINNTLNLKPYERRQI